MIAKNGIQLLDDWPFTFTNTTMVYFPEYPEPPQGDVFRYRIGRVRVMLPDGRQRYLDIGNVSCSRMKPNQIAPYAVPISSSSFIVLDTIMSIQFSPILQTFMVLSLTAIHQLHRIRAILALQCYHIHWQRGLE